MSRIFVTGSEGFIGKYAVLALQKSGHEVFTLDLLPSEQRTNHFQSDIRSADLDLILNEIKPEVVVHLAAQVVVTESFVDPENDLEINGVGTLRLVHASINSGCRNFCYIHSGGAVYDSDANLPLTETSPERPVSPYGLTKKLGEGYVRVLSQAAGTAWSSLAYSNVYGSVLTHQRGVIYEFWKALSEGRSPSIFGKDVTRDFLYIEDAVRAIVLAAENPTNTRVNISSATEITLMALYEKISKYLAVEINPNLMPARNGEILRSRLDNSKAKKVLNWSPKINLETGIQLCIPKSLV